MRISLIGFMGSGKSQYGAELAMHLNYSFSDTDLLVEKLEKKSINSIFTTNGELYFRKKEQLVLTEILKTEPLVLSTGGGLPAYSDNMDLLLEKSLVIFLKPEVREIYDRLRNDFTSRPLLRDVKPENLFEHIRELYNHRLPFYRKAQLVISPLDLAPVFLADYIRKYYT